MASMAAHGAISRANSEGVSEDGGGRGGRGSPSRQPSRRGHGLGGGGGTPSRDPKDILAVTAEGLLTDDTQMDDSLSINRPDHHDHGHNHLNSKSQRSHSRHNIGGGKNKVHPGGGGDQGGHTRSSVDGKAMEEEDEEEFVPVDRESRDAHSLLVYKQARDKYGVPSSERREREQEEVQEMIRAMTERVAVPRFLLMPDSRYMQRWDLVTMVALLFTAFVTPYEVALLNGGINALWGVNRFIDAIFLKDMIMQFFLAYHDFSSNEAGGTLVKEFSRIRSRYLHSWFTLDFCSILPFDVLGFFFESDAVSSLRIVRVMKLLKLVKLMRILRASRIFKRFDSTRLSSLMAY